MLAFLIASAVAAEIPPAPPPIAWDSPDFATALEGDRAQREDTVNLMVAVRLAGASWYVCSKGVDETDRWAKRNRLTDAEELLLTVHCLSYWFGQRDMAKETQKLFQE